MVASASSSKHQCPSGFCASSIALVAEAMLLLSAARSTVMRPSVTSAAARLPERVAPSSVAGSPVAVQSPARNRFSHWVRAPGRFGVLGRRRGEGRAPLAHDLPRRQVGGNSRGFGDLVPDRLRKLRARHVHQAVGAADRHRQPPFERENPFGRRVDQPLHRRHAGRHVDLEMGVGDGAVALRHREPGHQRRRGMRRHRDDHGIAGR